MTAQPPGPGLPEPEDDQPALIRPYVDAAFEPAAVVPPEQMSGRCRRTGAAASPLPYARTDRGSPPGRPAAHARADGPSDAGERQPRRRRLLTTALLSGACAVTLGLVVALVYSATRPPHGGMPAGAFPVFGTATGAAPSVGPAAATGSGSGGGPSALPPAGGAALPPAAGGAAAQRSASAPAAASAPASTSASASASRTPGHPGLLPAGTALSLRSVNYPDRYLTVHGGLGFLDPVRSTDPPWVRQSARLTPVAGLADARCFSLRTASGRYLRHYAFRVREEAWDGTPVFARDATFCARAGAARGSVSLESYGYPGRFLRHRDFQLWVDPAQGTPLYRADSSFRVAGALG